MPKSKKINSRNKRAREAKAASQNTVAANQPLNTNNPPPNVPSQPTELFTNQNLQNSAASAAALPLLQQMNSTSTNVAMDIRMMIKIRRSFISIYFSRCQIAHEMAP